MSDSDSFINEVSEEVRRDRIYAFFRRWGWLMGLTVVAIVGAAAFFELRRASEVAAAQAFGDAVIVALDEADAEDRRAALDGIVAETPGAEMLLTLLVAAEETATGDPEAAAARLREIAGRADMPERYRDLADLKAHLLAPADAASATAMLDRLSRPGAPYRALAIEQLAYQHLRDGDQEAALTLLEELRGEAGTSLGLQQRVRQLIVSLESGAELTDADLPDPGGLALPVGEVVEGSGDAAEAEGDTSDPAETE